MTNKKVVISITPSRDSKNNKFIGQFADSIEHSGANVQDFSWTCKSLATSDAIIFHWPDEFFLPTNLRTAYKLFGKLGLMKLAKILFGTRFIWVAHNAKPHGSKHQHQLYTNLFLSSLNGMIYLSAYSRSVVTKLYPQVADLPSLETVHGHYRDSMESISSPLPTPGERIKLAYFGQIRPYKNVLELVSVVSTLPSPRISLTVMGMQQDEELSEKIEAAARCKPHIQLDLRHESIPDAELEAAIDASDAVVLPYSDILNSGSAFFALSRNRPVLAPNIGSLSELQAIVGQSWLYLYEGKLTAEVIEAFLKQIRSNPINERPDLSAYDWDPIGRNIHNFIENIR
jgi:beta-1,4-mannosyltransferase